ncbi:MAG: Fic family protein [Candidatus Levybacteria bacterium]|nr:Fic family protein [Candidatus Levybacteria bacterium]
MHRPTYTITPKLLSAVSEIERLYGRLEGMKAPQSLLLNLERDNLIESSYASNSIEGNSLSQPAVTNLLLNDRVPTNRDEKEVVNYFQTLKTLEKRLKEPITVTEILSIHAQLMSGIDDKNKGQIRNEEIIVGNRDAQGEFLIRHNPPFHDRATIEKALRELTSWLGVSKELPILKAGIFHHQFVYIHPFVDGNGRTCRLTTALIFLKHNYLINKYFVLDDYYDIDRNSYSDNLHSADNGNQTQWLEYFAEGVKFSLQSALGRIEAGMNQLSFGMRPSPRETDALKIIQKYRQMNTADLVRELKITRQQAFNLLKALTEKGFIEKKGSTKDSYYILKD